MPSRTPGLFAEDESAAWITAHCDGGSRGNPGPAGYGAVITADGGSILAELSEFLGIRTNNFAEYSGLLASLQWALDHHHTHLRVVSDSELMVKQIQGKYKVNSPDLRPLWEEARRRIARLAGFQITHALRHKNKDADRLANQAMDHGTGRTPKSEPAASSAPSTHLAPRPKSSHRDDAADRPAVLPSAGPAPAAPKMLRGFTRNGVIHLLGDARLPDGVFVKVLPE